MTNQHAVAGFLLSFIAGIATMAIIHKKAADDIGPDARSSKGASAQVSAGAPKNPGAVPVELYVMSQCPYGVQAFNEIKPALDKLGADVDLQLNYIGQEESPGSLTSMHGQSEVTGDIAQLCVLRHAPDSALDIISCQNENMSSVDTNWQSCATKVGAKVDPIKACIEGAEGKELLSASFKRASAKGATGSPTIYIGGKPYNGTRSASAFTRAICAAHSGPAPAACKDIPESPTVNVKIISDKRCSDCDPARLAQVLEARVGKPSIQTLDYGDAEGKKLYDAVGGGMVPMIVFDETLDADPDAQSAIGRFERVGSYRRIVVGQWNPVCAGAGACSLSECVNDLACRPESKNSLELFVMSQCPYGVSALNAMEEVLKNFGSALKFQVHYIANGTVASGFTALHGQSEVDENIRGLCAIKHYGASNKFMDYIWCRNKAIQSSDWQSCTGSNGIATAKIQSCFDGEGKKLHEEDIKIANGAGIGASPTWLVNGRNKFSGIDAETIRKNVCEHNPGLKGCENTLSGAQMAGAVGAGCQ